MDFLKAKGFVTLELTSPDGKREVVEVPNLVVDVGLAYIASRMKDATATAISHAGIGTDSNAAADIHTSLLTQVARVALTSTTIVTTTVANDSVQYTVSFGPGVGTGAITEAGLFNAASAGTMLARTVFPVINKGAADTLSITWKVTIS